MDSTKENYIILGYYEADYNGTSTDSVGNLKRVDCQSWQISYQKYESYYLCKVLSSGKFLLMKSIEDFITIWSHEMMAKKYDSSSSLIKISLRLKNKWYSECTNCHSCVKPMNIAKQYANILKELVTY